METIIKTVDKRNIDTNAIAAAGAVLKAGGLVAFPTETVYGLGADALNEAAAARIYRAKGRPSDNPLIVHIAEVADLERITSQISAKAQAVAAKFWPGPLTLILDKSPAVPLGTTGGLQTVAVRLPSDAIARALIKAGGGYIAAPSANTSGRPSPTTAQHVYEDLAGKIEMIIDGGMVRIGVESTILDMTVEPPMILRPGAITREMFEAVIGPVQEDVTLLKAGDHPKAPGMKYRHYAPRAELSIVEGEMAAVVAHINALTRERRQQGAKVGIICTSETKAFYQGGDIKVIGTRDDETTIAHNLYEILREFDEEEVAFIYSEAFDTKGIGKAIMNRLLKAAGHHVIKL